MLVVPLLFVLVICLFRFVFFPVTTHYEIRITPKAECRQGIYIVASPTGCDPLCTNGSLEPDDGQCDCEKWRLLFLFFDVNVLFVLFVVVVSRRCFCSVFVYVC